MDKKIMELCGTCGLSSGRITSYKGGYPIVEFEIPSEKQQYNKSQRELDKIVRKAEMSIGMKLGVGMNFRKTAFVKWERDRIIVCGYIEVIEKIVKELFHK